VGPRALEIGHRGTLALEIAGGAEVVCEGHADMVGADHERSVKLI
jgi:hypothetical protein